MTFQPIENYGIIGNLCTAALVGIDLLTCSVSRVRLPESLRRCSILDMGDAFLYVRK
jgi:hypothetical protein